MIPALILIAGGYVSGTVLAVLEGSHEIVGTVRRDPLPRVTTVRLDLDVTIIDGEAADGGLRLTVREPQQPLRAGAA